MIANYTGEFWAILTALCWTVSTLSSTSASQRIGSLSVNWIRLLLAWTLFCIQGLICRGMPLPLDAPPRAWLWLSISGFVGFFLGDLCLFRAFVLLGARMTALIMSLAPPIAAVLAMPILGERLSALNWLGMAVTLAGVAWVVLERTNPSGASRPSTAGVILAILAAAGQAVGAILSKIGMGAENYDPFASTQIRVLTGLSCFTVLLLTLGWFPRVRAAFRRPDAMALVVLATVVGPFLGVSLFLLSLQYIATGMTQTIVAIVPVLILPFVVVLYKERVSWRAAFGACVTVAGIALLFVKG